LATLKNPLSKYGDFQPFFFGSECGDFAPLFPQKKKSSVPCHPEKKVVTTLRNLAKKKKKHWFEQVAKI
jgi:hypothetical protein